MSIKDNNLENVIDYHYLNNSIYQNQIILSKNHHIKPTIQKTILILHNLFQIH